MKSSQCGECGGKISGRAKAALTRCCDREPDVSSPMLVGAVVLFSIALAIVAACGNGKKAIEPKKTSNVEAAPLREPNAESPTERCSLRHLKCDQFATKGRLGGQLHELVRSARVDGRYPEAICLAQNNISATSSWLVGASHLEASQAWEALACHELAVSEAELALERPKDGDWSETCGWCKQLRGQCGDCDSLKQLPSSACPKDLSMLSPKLQAALKTARKITILQCASGRFPSPGLLLVAWADSENNDSWQRHNSIIGVDDSLLADAFEDVSPLERLDDELRFDNVRTVDFDGDACDEILQETTYVHRGFFRKSIQVLKIRGAGLFYALDLQLSYSDAGMAPESGSTTCESTANLTDIDGIKSIVVKSSQRSGPEANEACPAPGKYQMRGSKFTLVN